MSDSLDNFNRRMTAGSSSWMQGPPANTAESAAQSFIDQRSAGATGGGSIDFGVRASAIILLAGVGLFVLGTYLTDNFREGVAMTGLLMAIGGGFLMLIGGGGLVVGCIKNLGSARGWRSIVFAALAALAAWWLAPWLWMATFALLPKGLMPLVAAALTFVFTARR